MHNAQGVPANQLIAENSSMRPTWFACGTDGWGFFRKVRGKEDYRGVRGVRGYERGVVGEGVE